MVTVELRCEVSPIGEKRNKAPIFATCGEFGYYLVKGETEERAIYNARTLARGTRYTFRVLKGEE